MCTLHSRMTVGTALSSAKCTSRRQGPRAVPYAPCAASRAPQAAAATPPSTGRRRRPAGRGVIPDSGCMSPENQIYPTPPEPPRLLFASERTARDLGKRADLVRVGRGDGPRAPPTPRRALRTRKCSSNRHSRVQSAPLECKTHISTRKGPVGRAARVRAGRIPHSGRRIPETAPRARRTARSSRRRPSRRRPSHRLPSRHRPSRRRNPTRSRHAARRSDGLSPPMPDRAGFIILKG